MECNLLTNEVVKIIHSEGARYEHPGPEGFAFVSEVVGKALEAISSDPKRATVTDFRILYHKHWDRVMELLVPSDVQDRVTDKFKALVF